MQKNTQIKWYEFYLLWKIYNKGALKCEESRCYEVFSTQTLSRVEQLKDISKIVIKKRGKMRIWRS